jgi:hypothetical protein
MLKNVIFILLVCVLAISCDDSVRIKKPDNLIAKDKMSDILYDLYTINAAKGVSRSLLETNGFIPETYVLTKYNIDSIQFADSNTYYAFDTESYRDIIEKVKARLEKDKTKYEDLREAESIEERSKRDSIKNIKPKKIKGIFENHNDSTLKTSKPLKDTISKLP